MTAGRAVAAALLFVAVAGCTRADPAPTADPRTPTASSSSAPAPAPAPTPDPARPGEPGMQPGVPVDPPIRVSVAAGCPRLTKLVAGVVPVGPPVRQALVPVGRPLRGIDCSYSTGHAPPGLLAHARTLDASAAPTLADRLRAMPLVGAPHEEIACVASWVPPGGELVVLSYPDRPDVGVWLRTGCPREASNGWVQALDVPV